jgi:hypothetical protein
MKRENALQPLSESEALRSFLFNDAFTTKKLSELDFVGRLRLKEVKLGMKRP